MPIIDTDGVVTKETKYGDTSRILTLITRNMGKISVLAGNARRAKSGLLSATSLFAYSKFTLFKSSSSSLYKLNEGELISSFNSLKESLEKNAYASYLCDITNSVVQENVDDISHTQLLLRSLYMLEKCTNDFEWEKIKAVFEFRTLTLCGLLPDLSVCGDCKRTDSLTALSPLDGRIFCEKCAEKHKNSLKLNDSILAAISYISVADDKKIFAFNMSPEALKYLSILGENCIRALLEKDYKTLDYLRKVTNL